MLNKLYRNQAAWTEYFNFLKNKVRSSETISNANYYLNEIEALGQSGMFESINKKRKRSKLTYELKKAQDKLRVKIIKYFLDIYADAGSWKSLTDSESFRSHDNMALKTEIKNNDELNIKTFQKNLYDRIINTIFKSIKFLSTSKKSNDNDEPNGNNANSNLGSRKDSGNSGNLYF